MRLRRNRPCCPSATEVLDEVGAPILPGGPSNRPCGEGRRAWEGRGEAAAEERSCNDSPEATYQDETELKNSYSERDPGTSHLVR